MFRKRTYVLCIQYTNVCSRTYVRLYTRTHKPSCASPWYSSGAAKKLRLGAAKAAALYFQGRRKSCVLFPLQKSCVFVCFCRAVHEIWQKNSNFFRKSYKNLKKLIKNLIFKVKFWRRMSQQKQNKIWKSNKISL